MDTGAADFDCRYRGSVYYDGHDVSGLFAHLHIGCMGGWNRVSFSAISSVCGSACMLESASGTKKQFSRLCAAPCAYEEIPLGHIFFHSFFISRNIEIVPSFVCVYYTQSSF